MDNKVENYFEKISKKCKISNKKKFDILVVDPPWNQGKTGFRDVRQNQTKILDYPTLSKEDIKKLDTWIKSYLEIENIPYIDLSKIDYKKRQDYVTKQILING